MCLVLTDKGNPEYPIDMQFYNCYFEAIRKQVVSDLADGTSKLTIAKDILADYYIEYIPFAKQQEFVRTKLQKFLNLQEQYRKEQELLSAEISKLSD